MERAARLGLAPARALWHMTPKELELAVQAEKARQASRLEWADALAWLAGGYAALGVHAPQRYPRRPEGLRSGGEMTDAEMERAALAFAARRTGGESDGEDA